jgi:xylulokinase
VRRVNLISDYFTHWLTGVRATEAGAQGLTGLCDIRTLEWVKRACAEFGVEQDWLPPIVRAGTDLGRVRTQRARELGLSENCRLVVGCLDQYAGAIGVGNVHPGGCSETTGTVLAVVQCSESPVRGGDGVFQGPGWAGDRFYRMRFGSVSANLLEWYRNQLPDRPSFAALDGLAAAVPPGAGGVRVTVNETGGGMITGFTGGDRLSDPGHCVRAILERVAVALEEHVGALCGAARPSGIRCAGGGARSRLWLQIKADLVGIPMTATACTEPTSLGAAMLGATALGWGTLPQLAARWVHPVLTCVPDPQRHESYRRLYGIGG